ncbi:MAG: 3-isopropylmalate dehydratase small subunit [Pseudooceanicola nanhaiensis]
MTEPIETIRGRGLPLPGDDIDTDQIIESRYLKMTTFRGMEAHVFESLRHRARRAGGAPHPFDAPQHAGASILLVGRNFGCGSSREHAPQALYRFGICAIVGQSFGEIFAGNCLAIGLPCVSVSAEDGECLHTLSRADPGAELTLDIREGGITARGLCIPFDLPEGRRHRLLDGSWDSLAMLLAARHSIRERLAALPPVGRS